MWLIDDVDYKKIRDLFDEKYKETRKLIRKGENHLDNLAEGFTEADKVLWKYLHFDAVKVVRCKDCKWYGVDREKGGFCMRTFSPSMWRNETGELKPTDFCSYGELKEREGK